MGIAGRTALYAHARSHAIDGVSTSTEQQQGVTDVRGQRVPRASMPLGRRAIANGRTQRIGQRIRRRTGMALRGDGRESRAT